MTTPTRRRVLPAAPHLAERRRERHGRAWRRRLRWGGGSLAALVLVGLVSWLLLGSPLLAVDRVEVTGTGAVSVDQVRAATGPVRGTPLARVDLAAVRAHVAALAPVDHVRVARAWPHTLQVHVTERVALATLQSPDGAWLLVDDDGVRFSPSPTRPAGLPQVVLPDGPAPAARPAVQVLAALPAALTDQVAQVEEASPTSVVLVLRDQRRVVWGDASRSERKVAVVLALLPHGGKELDVTDPDLAVVR